MQPTDDFWAGTGAAIANSPGWMVVVGVCVIAVAFIVAYTYGKYVRPSRERMQARELDVREHEAQNDSERIKANATLAEAQRQTNLLVDGMRQSLDASTSHTDVLVSELRGSRDRSREMGERVWRIDSVSARIDDTTARIDETTTRMAQQLDEVHALARRAGHDE